jgi:hypothetical protein
MGVATVAGIDIQGGMHKNEQLSSTSLIRYCCGFVVQLVVGPAVSCGLELCISCGLVVDTTLISGVFLLFFTAIYELPRNFF